MLYFDHFAFEQNFQVFRRNISQCKYFSLKIFIRLLSCMLYIKLIFARFKIVFWHEFFKNNLNFITNLIQFNNSSIFIFKMESQKQIHEYLNQHVNPVMSQMLVDIIKQRPKNILVYCKLWCQKKIQFHRTITHIDTDEEEQDIIQDCVFKVKLQRIKSQTRRNGISGESYGSHLKEQTFEPKIIKKKGLVKNRILFRLKSTFLFNDISDCDMNILINAMQETQVQAGAVVIKEGDIGDQVYILDQGQLQCLKKDIESDALIMLKDIKQGEIFGELSMLYNIPRTATIRAKKTSTLFRLDRKTFSQVLRRKNLLKRKSFSQAIDSIELFKELNPQERIKLQDIIRQMNIHSNQYVIRQGRVGNKLYLVQKGQLVALKKNQHGNQNVVFQYKQGDYFGELSLISNKARAASVMALTNVKLLYIQRQAFSRVIGPMETILQRNQQIYTKYTKFIKENSGD